MMLSFVEVDSSIEPLHVNKKQSGACVVTGRYVRVRKKTAKKAAAPVKVAASVLEMPRVKRVSVEKSSAISERGRQLLLERYCQED
ncbi:hypothetical protein FEA48_30830 [Pseudomonas nitroreducens]|uniref:Uncharacterized protein n=1 Tax=Pseudomonas nitroreducens TaxID=46680 RepID=A0A5R8ZSZ0_PSENT|nr:hypothetical protein [Pseudomonas nitroreducens]TLP68250.1 hypothetical protein FEA48_30830 [Pseudomonas nitroreducens]